MNVATLERQIRDQPYHVAQPLHGGELPVVAIATVADGPGDEDGRCWRSEDGRGQLRAVIKRLIADVGQSMREREGSQDVAISERSFAHGGHRVWQLERGEIYA